MFSILRHLSTKHCSCLLLSAVLRPRGAATLPLGGRRCRSISTAGTALSSKPAARHGCGRMMGQTDRRTDARPFHRSCSAYYARSINNGFHIYRCTDRDIIWRENVDRIVNFIFISVASRKRVAKHGKYTAGRNALTAVLLSGALKRWPRQIIHYRKLSNLTMIKSYIVIIIKHC